MATPRPNILIITTDQQRFDTICAGGNPHIRTPHLDWLSETGVRFTNCYTDAPVCCAARASLLTGRYYPNLIPNGVGWWGQPSAADPRLTYAGVLTSQGYQTKSVGKQHFHPERCAYGFESMEILADYYRFMARHPHLGVPMDHGLGQNEMTPAISTVDEPHSLTHWIVDRAIDFVETRDTTRPFALYVGFSKPHPPFDPCRAYWEMYADADVPEPIRGEWSADPARIPAGFMEPTWSLNGADRFSPELVRDIRRAYYALITQIDYNLGCLFARLREMDLLDSTLIVFTADHGEMLGDHFMGAKSVFLEGSAHIPMLVRPPTGLLDESKRGSACDALVCLADVYPTLCAAAGVPAPAAAALDGRDLLATAGGVSPRDCLIGRCGTQHAVIEPPYKYLYTSLGGAELLFNLADDPREQRNLIGVPGAADTAGRLRERLVSQLLREKHPDVPTGTLRPSQPEPSRAALRAHPWPGFHSRHCPTDVTH